MSGIKFTIDLLDQATSKIDKTQSHLKSLEKQSEKTAKAIDGIASSLNKASVSQKILVEREAQAKRLAASQSKLVYTKENLSNIKEKSDLNDLSLLKYKADLKKYSADRARYNLETIKFKEKLNQEIVKDIKKQEKEFVQNIKKQGKEIDQRVTPISYIANPMGKAIGIVKTKGYSTMPTSIFEQTKIGGNYIPGYKDNYEQILKNNFTKELKSQQREAEKNTIRMAKEEIKATKERERAAKQEYKSQQERVKYNQKVTESYQKAKVTPINYVADSSGKIIGVASAGRTTNANVFASMGMGGGRVPPTPPAMNRQEGFLGGRRTFGQVLGGYAAYKTAVGVEGAVTATLNTPIQMEGIRASMEAMIFAGGNKNLGTLKGQSEKHIRFLYDLGHKYGVDFTDVAPDYIKMMSARAGGKSKFKEQDVKNITEAFTALSRVTNLNAEQTKGTFTAVSQMMGRDIIYGQELNQQLTERMSIARPVIEEAVRRTVEDPTLQTKSPQLYGLYAKYRNKKISLNDLLDKGVIGSGNLVHTLSIVQDMLGNMPQQKSHTFTGEVGRLQNAYKYFVDTSANKGGFPKIVARAMGAIGNRLDYLNRVITDPLLASENTITQILKADKEKIKIINEETGEERGSEITSKATALAYKATGPLGKSISAGLIARYGTKFLSKAPRLLGFGGNALKALANPIGKAAFLGMLSYETGKLIGEEYGNYAENNALEKEVLASKAYYDKKYNNNKAVNSLNNIPDIFKYKPNNMTLIPGSGKGDLTSMMTYSPNVQSQNVVNASSKPQEPMTPEAFFERIMKPQQVELILRIEGNSDGVFPNIFTSAGKKLNPGSNMISGGNSAN
jgi:hypothetical protein